MRDEEVLWEGTPVAGRAILVWIAISGASLGAFAVLYWYMTAMGRCVDVLIETDCTRGRRNRMGVVFIVLAVIAAASLLIATKIALGFPQERYTLTNTDVRVTNGWPLPGHKTQPIAYVTTQRIGNCLRFTGIGERPILFGPLRPAEVEKVTSIIKSIGEVK